MDVGEVLVFVRAKVPLTIARGEGIVKQDNRLFETSRHSPPPHHATSNTPSPHYTRAHPKVYEETKITGECTHFLLAIWAAVACFGLSSILACVFAYAPYLSSPPCESCDRLLIVLRAPPHCPTGMSRRPHVTGADDGMIGRAGVLRARARGRTGSSVFQLLPCACVS